MRWIAQVGHVTAKDVRHTRGVLLVYAALAGLAMAGVVSGHALGRYSPSSNTRITGMSDVVVAVVPMVTVMLGLIASVALQQSDSPTRATSFWASRPLAPSAVLSAKLALVGIAIIAVPVVLGVAALMSFGVSWPEAAAVVASSALSYCQLVLAMLVLGALTDDLPACIVAFLGLLVGMLFLSTVLNNSVPSTSSLRFATLPFSAIAVAAGVSVLAFLYRTHDRPRGAWVAGFAASAGLVLTSFTRPFSGGKDVAVSRAVLPLAIEVLEPDKVGEARRFSIRAQALGAEAGVDRFVLVADSVRLRSLNGKEVRLAGPVNATVASSQHLPLARSVRWILDEPAPWAATFLSVETRESDRALLAGGIDSAVVTGTVFGLRARVLASLPLKQGATATADGRRIAIYGFSHDATGADVSVRVSEPRDRESRSRDFALQFALRLQFAIVNDARGEAFLIESRGNSTGVGWAVLPWIGISTNFIRLSTTALHGATPALPRDDAWYAGAHLVVVDWSVVRRYRAHAEVAVR